MAQEEFQADPRLVLEVAKNRLDHQLSFADALDTKIAAFFAVGSALVGLLVAVIAFSPGGTGAAEVSIVACSLGIYVLLTVVAMVGVWPARWGTGPSPEWAWERAHEVDNDEFIRELISGYMEYWNENRSLNKRKTVGLRGAFAAVVLLTACVTAALVVVVVDSEATSDDGERHRREMGALVNHHCPSPRVPEGEAVVATASEPGAEALRAPSPFDPPAPILTHAACPNQSLLAKSPPREH